MSRTRDLVDEISHLLSPLGGHTGRNDRIMVFGCHGRVLAQQPGACDLEAPDLVFMGPERSDDPAGRPFGRPGAQAFRLEGRDNMAALTSETVSLTLWPPLGDSLP